MKAEITYNGARSYLVMGVKFIEGQTKTVSDPRVIEHCRNTAGFAVQVVKEKVVREVVPVAHPASEESEPRRRTKPAKSE